MAKSALVTGKKHLALFCFTHVFEKYAFEEGKEPNYSCAILIPKKDKETIQKINDLVEEKATEFFKGKIPKNFSHPLRDGDDKIDTYPEYEGYMFLNAKSNRKPQVVDEDGNDILSSEDFYSGCFGRAGLGFFGYDKAGNKGIGVALNTIQKLEDGDRLEGGGASADDDFND